MNNQVKSYKLEIFGDQYTLLSDESEQHVKEAAQLVDEYMKEIAHRGTAVNNKRIAVLAALRLASTLLSKESELEQKQLQEKELISLINCELQENEPST